VDVETGDGLRRGSLETVEGKEMSEKQMNTETWSFDLAFAALVKLARDPGLNEAQQEDVRHEILLMLGVIDGYTDSTGTVRVTPQEKRRMDKAAGLL
jgi:hypothetical protein